MNKEQLITGVYKKILLPLTSGNPEKIHNAIFSIMNHSDYSETILNGLKNEFRLSNMPKVSIDALKTEFPSPFLLAGGLLKTGVGAATIAKFGPGGVDIGTLTLQRRDGNLPTRKEKLSDGKEITVRRIERFKDGTIINWMGLPNPGIKEAIETLRSMREKIDVPIILNISPDPLLKDKEAIAKNLIEVLTPAYIYKPDAITVNISCPNVETGENREERHEDALWTIKTAAKILDDLEVKFKYRIPRLAKIGPDMFPKEIKEFIRATKENHYEGIVATNTTSDRTGARAKYAYIQKGGLSGPYLREKSLETVRLAREYDKESGGLPLIIIGCGGISTYKDYQQMRKAGSDEIVELMSGFIFGGPYFFKKLNAEHKNNIQIKKHY